VFVQCGKSVEEACVQPLLTSYDTDVVKTLHELTFDCSSKMTLLMQSVLTCSSRTALLSLLTLVPICGLLPALFLCRELRVLLV